MTSPMIQDAGLIAGEWRLELSDGQSCAVRLVNRSQAVEPGSLAADMLMVEADCAAAPRVTGWRPVPLGLDLADARGMTLFSFEQVGPEEYLSSATGARLSRR